MVCDLARRRPRRSCRRSRALALLDGRGRPTRRLRLRRSMSAASLGADDRRACPCRARPPRRGWSCRRGRSGCPGRRSCRGRRRARSRAHQDDALASVAHLLGAVGVEDGLADRRARRGVDARGQSACLPARRSIGRLRRSAAAATATTCAGSTRSSASSSRDQPLADHVDGDLDRGGGRCAWPLRVCSMYSLPRSTVNSRSCTSR